MLCLKERREILGTGNNCHRNTIPEPIVAARHEAPREGEELDSDAFIEALNDDLRTEFQSIIQYVQHVALITGAEYLSVVDELTVHLGQELNHAKVLAEQISFLGGTPVTSVPQVAAWVDSKSALEADLSLEENQLALPGTFCWRQRARTRRRRGVTPTAARADSGACPATCRTRWAAEPIEPKWLRWSETDTSTAWHRSSGYYSVQDRLDVGDTIFDGRACGDIAGCPA